MLSNPVMSYIISLGMSVDMGGIISRHVCGTGMGVIMSRHVYGASMGGIMPRHFYGYGWYSKHNLIKDRNTTRKTSDERLAENRRQVFIVYNSACKLYKEN